MGAPCDTGRRPCNSPVHPTSVAAHPTQWHRLQHICAVLTRPRSAVMEVWRQCLLYSSQREKSLNRNFWHCFENVITQNAFSLPDSTILKTTSASGINVHVCWQIKLWYFICPYVVCYFFLLERGVLKAHKYLIREGFLYPLVSRTKL